MPFWIARLLDHWTFAALARVLLTAPFWIGGIRRLQDFDASSRQLADFGLSPAVAINALASFVMIGGSLLVIINRRTWSGAGALAILALMAIPVAHDYWHLSGTGRALEFETALRQIGLAGGLMLAACLSRFSPRRGA